MDKELLEQAKRIVSNSKQVKPFWIALQDNLDNEEEFIKVLKEMSDQIWLDRDLAACEKTFGSDLVDIIKQLFPNK